MRDTAAAHRVPSSGRVGNDIGAPLALKGSASQPAGGGSSRRAHAEEEDPRGVAALLTSCREMKGMFLFFLFFNQFADVKEFPGNKWSCLNSAVVLCNIKEGDYFRVSRLSGSLFSSSFSVQ